jgi:hypothetical protein
VKLDSADLQRALMFISDVLCSLKGGYRYGMTQRQKISIMKKKTCQYLFSLTPPKGSVIPKRNDTFQKGMLKRHFVPNKQQFILTPTGETRQGKDGEYYFDGKGWCYVDGSTTRKYPIAILMASPRPDGLC